MDRPHVETRSRGRTAWHAWLFSAVVFALYSVGAYDFVELLGPDEAYVLSQGWGADGVAYFTGYPIVPRLIWALNLSAGLAAPILVVVQVRLAPAVALTAVATQLALMIITFGLMDRLAALGAPTAAFDSGILVVTALFWWYSRIQVPQRN